MLTLDRRVGESIVIVLKDGRQVSVVITGLNEFNSIKAARIGVDAPADVSVDRLEISQSKKKTRRV